MIRNIIRSLLLICLAAAITGCRLGVVVFLGGDVISASGSHDCLQGNACEIQIDDSNFTETFTAIPKTGYVFSRWETGDKFICGGSISPSCTVSNTAFAGNPDFEAVIASDQLFYIMPVFNKEPEEPVDPDNCGPLPTGVDVFEELNWANQGGQIRIRLPANGIKSSAFTTTSSTSYLGNITVVPVTGTGSYQRRAWISECPGGEPLDSPYCGGWTGTELSVRWSQEGARRGHCLLSPNTSYFINYENVNCALSSCDVYRQMHNNAEP